MAKHILLVDDEPGIRTAVSAYLEDSGYQVSVAANAALALEAFSKAKPDLVISDVMMPHMDGYAFLQAIRERDRAIPVVFLTAKGMTTDRIQGYQAGVDAYLPKPFDPDELVAIVDNLVQRTPALPEALAQELAEIKALLQTKTPIVATEPPPIRVQLTPREQEVLDLVAEGLMNKEIARKLETSIRNIEKYVTRLLNKTGTNSRTELVRFAITYGLVKL